MPRSFFPILLIISASCFAQPPERGDARPHPVRGLRLEGISWIADAAEFLDRRRFKTSLTKTEASEDREALLQQALDAARETGQPVLWYVYKVVESSKRGRQMIRAPILDLAMRQVVWSDPDVERIVKASFTPLRMVCDEALCVCLLI